MMKVLMTVDTIGGVWNYAIDLITALNQYRVEAALVSMGRKLSTQQRKQIAQLKNVQFFETTYKLEWMDDPWQDVKEAGEYLLEINDLIKPDIVHLNSYSHASLNFTAPVLVVAHSCVYSWYEAVFNRKPPAKWKKYFENVSLGLRAADSVTAPTHTMIKSLLKIYGRFNCTAPIYNGRNFICRQSEKLPFVFTAGRLWDDSKNIEAIQDAAEKIIWPVYAAGEKKHPDGYTKKFKHIHLLGSLSRDGIAESMATASIFVLPSKYEPFGLAALEAALGSCALVLSDIPSLREIWADSALYADPNNPDDIAEKINWLINNKQKLEYYALKAKKRAQIFSIERTAMQYFRLYKTMFANALICKSA